MTVVGAPGLLRWTVVVVVGAVALVALARPAAGATGDVPTEEDASGEAATGDGADPTGVAALQLSLAAVVGDGPDDGDLVEDEGTGLPTLVFLPGGPAEQTAVFEYVVTNVGDVPVGELAVVSPRAGVVLDGAIGTTLAPGAALTVRGGWQLTAEEARSGAAGLLPTSATASGTDPDGEPVVADAHGVVQVVAVLATPQADVGLEVTGGDTVVGPGDVPTVTWSAEDAARGDRRTVGVAVTVTNTGDTGLVAPAADVLVDGVVVASVDVAPALPVGESARVVVEVELDAPVADEGAAVEEERVFRVEVTATGEDGQAVSSSSGDVAVLAALVAPEQLEEAVLPAAGVVGAVPVAVLGAVSLLLGAVLLRRRQDPVVG